MGTVRRCTGRFPHTFSSDRRFSSGKLYSDFRPRRVPVVREAFEERFPELDRPVPTLLASSLSFGTLLNHHPTCMRSHPAKSSIVRAPSTPPTLRLRGPREQDALDEESAALVQSWEHSGFGVRTERVIEPGCRRELESILLYMERALISLKRITYLDTGMVHDPDRYTHTRKRNRAHFIRKVWIDGPDSGDEGLVVSTDSRRLRRRLAPARPRLRFCARPTLRPGPPRYSTTRSVDTPRVQTSYR